MSKMQVSENQAVRLINEGRIIEVSYRRGSTVTFGERCEDVDQLCAAMERKRVPGVAVCFVEVNCGQN